MGPHCNFYVPWENVRDQDVCKNAVSPGFLGIFNFFLKFPVANRENRKFAIVLADDFIKNYSRP